MIGLQEIKPLTPLESGNILIVGGKPSNFDDEIKSHPRIVMWDSQHEHWISKELPVNTRAIFMTRFIGHAAFKNIITEARKKNITIFNPEGTGMIVRQVRELLSLDKKKVTMSTSTATRPTVKHRGKLKVFIPFIDSNKNNTDNAKALITKAEELGVKTTLHSLANFIGQYNKKVGKSTFKYFKTDGTSVPDKTVSVKSPVKMDVSVDILDNVIKELKDMRDYLVAVTKENESLKTRIEKFKRALSND